MDLRERLVSDLNFVLSEMGLHVRPFGSSISNMGFPDSDVDLLLAGNWQGVPVYSLVEAQRKRLLRQVGAVLYRQRVVRGEVGGWGGWGVWVGWVRLCVAAGRGAVG